jgi:hypothetical protein
MARFSGSSKLKRKPKADLFLGVCRLGNTPWRFDLLAIETTSGQKPLIRLYESAFSEQKS